MSTETKLRTALDALDHRLSRKPQGKPMSGVSIPADYYFPVRGRLKRLLGVGRDRRARRFVGALTGQSRRAQRSRPTHGPFLDALSVFGAFETLGRRFLGAGN